MDNNIYKNHSSYPAAKKLERLILFSDLHFPSQYLMHNDFFLTSLEIIRSVDCGTSKLPFSETFDISRNSSLKRQVTICDMVNSQA